MHITSLCRRSCIKSLGYELGAKALYQQLCRLFGDASLLCTRQGVLCHLILLHATFIDYVTPSRARHDYRDAGTRASAVYSALPLCSFKYFKARYGCTAPSTAVALSANISASTVPQAASSVSVVGRPAYAATTDEITLLVTESLLADVAPAVLAHTSTNRRSSNRDCDWSATLHVATGAG